MRNLLRYLRKSGSPRSAIHGFLFVVFTATGLGAPGAACAQSDDLIDAIRDLAKESFDPVKIGAGYAAMVDFAVSRDISSA